MNYVAGQHYVETSRSNYFSRHYVVEETMEFPTLILHKQATVLRKDGKILARLERDGQMSVFPEYAWDGPSGPTVDTHAFILASAPHDVFYQMLRENLLINEFMYQGYMDEMYRTFCMLREDADMTMRVLNKKFGMTSFRAYYTWWFVQQFGEKNALPEVLKKWKLSQ